MDKNGSSLGLLPMLAEQIRVAFALTLMRGLPRVAFEL
jgi:hypothetical protein